MSDLFDDLKQLGEMRDRGEVTQAEYEKIKADLIAEMGGVQPPDPAPAEASARSHQVSTQGNRPWYLRWWAIALGVVVLIMALSSLGSDSGPEVEAAGTTVTEEVATTEVETITTEAEVVTPTEAPTAPAPEPQLTRSEENAIRSAKSYLSFSAFSRSGLIHQLEFEGFTNAEATLAVDYLNVDWNQQAVLSAESYLEFAAFSESGLIDQLEFEGFSNVEATHGVNSITVDWNEQAWKSAESYLEFSSFSRSGLIDQLLFEGFTQSQATYGVDKAGL